MRNYSSKLASKHAESKEGGYMLKHHYVYLKKENLMFQGN